MSRRLKEWMVGELSSRFSRLDEHGCVVVGFRGLDANEASQCRGILSENGADMMVIRNRLFEIALDEIGAPELKALLEGPTAVVIGEDAVQAAKAIAEAAEENEELDVRGGYAEGKILEAEEVEKLAALPDRETLLTQVLCAVISPASRFVTGINRTMQRFACAVKELEKKRAEEDEAGVDE
jgi:large subunit ribosomal protein L10